MNELIEIAKQILEANDNCFLSGSLALNHQGIKTRNAPGDIDIYLEGYDNFHCISGMKESYDFNSDDYYNEEWERTHYKIGDVKVDVFVSTGNYLKDKLITVNCNGIDCVRFDEILKFKIQFAFDDSDSAEKHQADLQYIIGNAKPISNYSRHD